MKFSLTLLASLLMIANTVHADHGRGGHYSASGCDIGRSLMFGIGVGLGRVSDLIVPYPQIAVCPPSYQPYGQYYDQSSYTYGGFGQSAGYYDDGFRGYGNGDFQRLGNWDERFNGYGNGDFQRLAPWGDGQFRGYGNGDFQRLGSFGEDEPPRGYGNGDFQRLGNWDERFNGYGNGDFQRLAPWGDCQTRGYGNGDFQRLGTFRNDCDPGGYDSRSYGTQGSRLREGDRRYETPYGYNNSQERRSGEREYKGAQSGRTLAPAPSSSTYKPGYSRNTPSREPVNRGIVRKPMTRDSYPSRSMTAPGQSAPRSIGRASAPAPRSMGRSSGSKSYQASSARPVIERAPIQRSIIQRSPIERSLPERHIGKR